MEFIWRIKNRKYMKNTLTAIGVLVLVALFLGLPLMWIWNWVMPDIFGLAKITFSQAIGLNLLSIILFSRTNIKE